MSYVVPISERVLIVSDHKSPSRKTLPYYICNIHEGYELIQQHKASYLVNSSLERRLSELNI